MALQADKVWPAPLGRRRAAYVGWSIERGHNSKLDTVPAGHSAVDRLQLHARHLRGSTAPLETRIIWSRSRIPPSAYSKSYLEHAP
jgi:hypothetical protein